MRKKYKKWDDPNYLGGRLYNIVAAIKAFGGASKSALAKKADLDDEGLIPISQIPPVAFSDCITVQNDTERFALTVEDVQKGDNVYVNSSEIMYFVIDDTKLDREAGYKPLAAGTAAQAIADKDGNELTATYQKTIVFEGTYNASTNKATTMSDIKDGKLTGYAKKTGNVAATDKVVEAIGKLETKADNNETNISSLSGHFTFSANSGHYYLQPEQPSSPAEGDIWIG